MPRRFDLRPPFAFSSPRPHVCNGNMVSHLLAFGKAPHRRHHQSRTEVALILLQDQEPVLFWAVARQLLDLRARCQVTIQTQGGI